MSIPKYNERTRSQQSQVIAQAVNPIRTAALGKGLEDMGQGIEVGRARAAAELKKRNDKRDNLWISKSTISANRQVVEHLKLAELNPSMTQGEAFTKEFGASAQTLLDGAPSEDAAEALAIRLEDMEVRALPSIYGLEAKAKWLQTTTDLSEVASDIQDVIALTPSPTNLDSQVAIYSAIVTDAEGSLIDPTTAKQFNDKAVNFRLEAIDVWAAQGYIAEAREALKNTKGISGSVRAAKINMLARTESQGRRVDNSLLQRDQAAYLYDLEANGRSDVNFSIDDYISTLPAGARVGERTRFNDATNKALALYAFGEDIAGASESEIYDSLNKLSPENNKSLPSNQQAEVFAAAHAAAATRSNMIKTDPWSAAEFSPVMQQYRAMAAMIAQDDPQGIALSHDAMVASKRVQEDMGVLSRNIKVASQHSLGTIATELTDTSAKDAVNRITSLKSQYDEFFPVLLMNLGALPSGQRPPAALSMVSSYIDGEQTEPFVYKFLESSRMSVEDLGANKKQYTAAMDSVGKGAFSEMKAAMISAGGVSAIARATEAQDAMVRFVLSKEASGQDRSAALKETADQLIKQKYHFGKNNGRTFSMPTDIPNLTIDKATARTIEKTLSQMTDPKVLEKWGPSPFGAPNPLPNRNLFHPQSIGDKFVEYPPGINKGEKTEILNRTYKEDMYWAASPEGTGVVLLGRDIGGNDAVPVKDNEGEPISLLFVDILAFDWKRKNALPMNKRITNPELKGL